MQKKLQLIALLNAIGLVLLIAFVSVGTVTLRARLTPDKKKWSREPLPGPLVTIGDQIYNLGDHDRYLKATIVLEVDTGEKDHPKKQKEIDLVLEELKKRDAKLRDIIIREINGWSFVNLNSPEGKLRLKKTILDRINEELSQGELKRVMITEFALQ